MNTISRVLLLVLSAALVDPGASLTSLPICAFQTKAINFVSGSSKLADILVGCADMHLAADYSP
jgi:hypothetical protein